MPQWLENIILGPCYALGNAIWNAVMKAIAGVIVLTPQNFSRNTWNYVTETLYPWSLGCGIAIINVFFLVGFLKSVSNLRENVTIEMFIELLIKMLIANALIQSGLSIIQQLFDLASLLSGQVLLNNLPQFTTDDIDLGAWLFFFVFGCLYVLVAIICAVIILLTVYGRYLKLYWLAAVAPIALSSLAGGRGLENSAFAWIRTFLSTVFEILVIAMIMSLGGMMIKSIDLATFDNMLGSIVDGMAGVFQSLLTMILMTAAVKGASSLLSKTFGL